MPTKQKIQIIKVPHSGNIVSKPQIFPRMPRLYLELIENKDKIKQELINKEHFVTNTEKYYNYENSHDDSYNKKDYNYEKSHDDSYNKKMDTIINDNSDSSSNPESIDNDDKSVVSVSTISDLSIKEDINKKSDDNLSCRLKELLNDDDSSVNSTPPHHKYNNNKYSRHRDKNGYSVSKKYEAPTLSELEKNGSYIPNPELPNMNQYNFRDEQQQEDLKRELMFKFDLLRKSYPNASIPEYNIHTDLSVLEKSYDDCVRRLSLDSTVESYKTYLVYGFMGCEFIFGNFLGFDMQGFTQQQIVSMNSYEKLLIELGEKSYIPSGSKWPVELRLVFLIIMNAAFFIVSKMMMKKTGANLMGLVNNMNRSEQNSIPLKQKRKMRGPDINFDDLPEQKY